MANILKHNGMVKLADFGFAKLLGNSSNATTMLGSPLNMAPEILNGKQYNNKADVWSVGTCFYELIYGKPPYVASNIVDLLNKMNKTKPVFNPNVKVSDVSVDLIKKMLIINPEDRISWEECFIHKINYFLDEKLTL